MTPEKLGQVEELKGRKTSMEIVNIRVDDKIFKYEIVHRSSAVAAILETEDGRFIFINQFRIPVHCEILEAVAGCIDGNEHPVECIKREVEEETGHQVIPSNMFNENIRYLGSVIASPGYSDEIIHLYYAKVNSIAGKQRPDDDERIKVSYFTFDQIQNIVEKGEIKDAKTLLVWYEYLRQIKKNEM